MCNEYFGKGLQSVIPFCAKQGVEQKISFEDYLSAMLSDYECAYACGLAARLLKLSAAEDVGLSLLKGQVEAAMPKERDRLDYHIRNLYKLIGDYAYTEKGEMPEEIPVLIRMGLGEEGYDCYLGNP